MSTVRLYQVYSIAQKVGHRYILYSIMGGDFYDRDVISSSGNNAYGNDVVGKASCINKALDPKTYVVDEGHIQSVYANPIVFALDVTGSMGDWPKIIYDKMPMFYGQIMMKKYLTDPAISFCAVGDVKSDSAPLQVTRFGQGREIDQLIAKMWLQGGGGGNQHQSYDLSAYFYSHYCKFANLQMPFFFVTGDEGYWEKPSSNEYEQVLGQKPVGESVNALKEWRDLMTKYNVFHLKKQYDNGHYQQAILKQWVDTLGDQRVIKFSTPKASVDIVLGLICLTSGSRTLQQYINDMEQRGQDKERIIEVSGALANYWKSMLNRTAKIVGKVKPAPIGQQSLNQFRAEYLSKISKEPVSQDSQILSKLYGQFSNEVSESFLCPLTKQIMTSPVLAADGNSYEEQAIKSWLSSHIASPVENTFLDSNNLVPNNALKKLIAEWRNKKLNKA